MTPCPEGAVVQRLLEVAAVTAIVGSRIYLDRLPQAPTYPAVLVQLVHEPSDQHLRGGARMRARVQVDAYAQEKSGTNPYDVAVRLADAIHGDGGGSGLEGWFGSVGTPPFVVRAVLRIERTREYDPEELQLLRQRQDYWIHFS